MRLSIITINYNNREGLRRTIDSVMAQTWRDFEWIIIDGGSTDGSRELIEATAARPESNISYWCSEPDKGVYNAMNKGIAHVSAHSTLDTNHSPLPTPHSPTSTPHYLNFMNSGDCYHEPTTLAQVFDGKEYDADVLYGESLYHYKDSTEHRIYPDNVSLNYFINNQHINHQSIFIKRELQLQNLYNEECKISSDYRFLLHCQFEGASFFRLDGIIICDYDATGISQTQPFNAWSEAHTGLELELISRYFSPDVQRAYYFICKRRVYKRVISWCINIFEFIEKLKK